MMMEEEEGEVALQEPTVADVGLDETGPTGLEAPSVKVMVSSLNEALSNVQYKKTLKVVTLEVKVGEERGVLLQRWQHQGREGEQPQVDFVWGRFELLEVVEMILTSCTKVRYTKEGRGGVANEEV